VTAEALKQILTGKADEKKMILAVFKTHNAQTMLAGLISVGVYLSLNSKQPAQIRPLMLSGQEAVCSGQEIDISKPPVK
jgi:hypothetical protein